MVLVGPAGSGKTTLAETLLAAAGAIPRAGSVRDGTTVCDFEEPSTPTSGPSRWPWHRWCAAG